MAATKVQCDPATTPSRHRVNSVADGEKSYLVEENAANMYGGVALGRCRAVSANVACTGSRSHEIVSGASTSSKVAYLRLCLG